MEKPPNIIEGQASKESPATGVDVKIILKFIRHGERTKEGELTDLGRKITKKRAGEQKEKYKDFHAVKALGSPAGPKGPTDMPRSLETAHIYAQGISGQEIFTTRSRDLLSYEKLKTPVPYDHIEIYNSNLPPDFDALSDDEKIAAAKKAQAATINYLFSLQTPQADTYRQEAAGAFATFIDRYMRLVKRLKTGSRVLQPAGTHGGSMEHLLFQALVHKNKEGKEVVGLKNMDEIGGGFDPSEAYNVFVETDEKGELKALQVTFDNLHRPQGEMHIDMHKLQELKNFYETLHIDDK